MSHLAQPASSISLGPLTITLHRTCRVPRQKGLVNELPASLGNFPVYRVADFRSGVPEDWKDGGHFVPVWEHEALWIGFSRPPRPVALVVGAGMVNAVTGKRLEGKPSGSPQDYLVVPPQPWLDGFKPMEGEQVFQFVAARLGSGETAEEQILGTAEFGGLQFGLFLPRIPLIPASRPSEHIIAGLGYKSLVVRTRGGSRRTAQSMGLGAGGAIRQKIYPDPYLAGRQVSDVWPDEPSEKAYVYLVHSADFLAITGRQPPPSPINYQTYQEHGLPWFGLPDGTWGDVQGSEAISSLKPVGGNPDPVNAQHGLSDPATKNLW